MNGFLRLRPLEFDLGDLFVQIVAVALGVMAGLAVSSWQEHVHDRSVLRASVTYIAAEIANNQREIEDRHAYHLRAARAMTSLDVAARSRGYVGFAAYSAVLTGAMPDGFGEVVPETTAWQIAQREDALTLLAYPDRAELTALYDLQGLYVEAQQRAADAVFMTPGLDANFYLDTVSVATHARIVASLEHRLDAAYTHALQRLREEYHLPAG